MVMLKSEYFIRLAAMSYYKILSEFNGEFMVMSDFKSACYQTLYNRINQLCAFGVLEMTLKRVKNDKYIRNFAITEKGKEFFTIIKGYIEYSGYIREIIN